MRQTSILVAVVMLLASQGVAHSQRLPSRATAIVVDPLEDLERLVEAAFTRVGLGQILKNALARARRSIVLGPYAAAGGAVPFEGDASAVITGGIGMTKFDISISPKALLERAAKKVLAKLPRDRRPTREELDQVIDQVVGEIIADLRGRGYSPKRFEKPGSAIRLEGSYYTASEAWEVRFGVALGISKVFVGTGFAAAFNDGTFLSVPIELSVPMTLSRGKRSPLADFFARLDIPVSKRDVASEVAVFGLRLHLDII